MAAERESPGERPKVTLILEDGPLRRRLLDVLAASGVDVEVLDAAGDLAAGVRASRGHVVVVSEEQVGEDAFDTLEEIAGDADEPGVAVIGEDDPGERVKLLAAGVSGVLAGDEDEEQLGESLAALAGAEAHGGLSGPEVGGAATRPRLADFLSKSPRMQEFLQLVQRVVAADTSLLITGPTGVGKERLARAIHAESPRGSGPFVAVNCAALAEQLLESELFGHEKGAFTGAERARKGHFELASGGTIFLDEVGEMPLHLQVKLLTVLQRHEVTRVGAEKARRVDVRVMAATNRDLEAEVAAGRFREDLLYRLKVVPLRVPPLRERPEDVPELVGRFIQHFRSVIPSSRAGSLSQSAVDALMAYDWPGNVRELVNVIERAMLLSSGPEITLSDLPPVIAAPERTAGGAAGAAVAVAAGPPAEWLALPIKAARERAIEWAERAYLEHVLRETRGHVARTAQRAGLGPRALYEKMKRYGLRKEDFKE